MEFYAAERKKELIPFATTWMELESIMLSEISPTVRDKCILTSFFVIRIYPNIREQLVGGAPTREYLQS